MTDECLLLYLFLLLCVRSQQRVLTLGKGLKSSFTYLHELYITCKWQMQIQRNQERVCMAVYKVTEKKLTCFEQ